MNKKPFDIDFPSPEKPLHNWKKEGFLAMLQEIEVWRTLPKGMEEIKRRLNDPNRFKSRIPFTF